MTALHWDAVGHGDALARPTTVAVSGATLYVGVESGDIHASDDEGASWRLVATTPDGVCPRDMTALDGSLHVATEIGVLRLGVDGEWSTVPLTPPIIRSVTTHNGSVFVLTDSAVYRSPSPDGPWARVSERVHDMAHIHAMGGVLYGAARQGVVYRADITD
jgi:hypothetical protein